MNKNETDTQIKLQFISFYFVIQKNINKRLSFW